MKKKYAIMAALLALVCFLGSTAAVADSFNPTPSTKPVGFEGSIVEVIAGESVSANAGGESSPEPAGCVPVAENQEIETYRGVSVGGQLRATDPDGDELHFEITTEPIKGSVVLTPDGCFIYTPDEGKKGKDYFAFRAVDSKGNQSQEATVIIKLLRQRSDICYSDLIGDECAYSATVLAENGIFTGERVGASWVYHPDDEVSRGEFLSMCMVLGGEDILQGVLTTGFLDDDEIDDWMKPYVSTALTQGYIQGVSADGGANFLAAECVSATDACHILNAVLGVTDVVSASTIEDSTPQAVINLKACGVLSDNASLDGALTRREAADMLAKALDILNAR